MTVQMQTGIVSVNSAPVPGTDLLFIVIPRLRITAYFPAFFIFFILFFSLLPKAITAETEYNRISGRSYLLSGLKLQNFYRMVYLSNTAERKVLLQQTPDEIILQYAENRLALFNNAMDKDPSGDCALVLFIRPGRITEQRLSFYPQKRQRRVYLRQKLTHYTSVSFSGYAIPMVIYWIKRKPERWKKMPYWPVK